MKSWTHLQRIAAGALGLAAAAGSLSALDFFQGASIRDARGSTTWAKNDQGDAAYSRGSRSLDLRDYSEAIQAFDRVIADKSSRADGAYYWKAYALNKLGRRDEALTVLAEIPREYPQSRWLNDAKALEGEVRQSVGKSVAPESESDDELKLLAINGLMGSDAGRATPMIEKVLADPKNSPKVKERALFVLAQNRGDQARELIARYARGGSNPDLQRAAIRYLGLSRSDATRELLISIYASPSDQNVKSAVLEALFVQGSAKELVEIARKESDPDLKRLAVRRISLMRSKTASDYMSELLTSK